MSVETSKESIGLAAAGLRIDADLLASTEDPPATSHFRTVAEAQDYLLELYGGVSLRRGKLYTQRIDRSGWGAKFVDAHFESDQLAPWIDDGLLEYDSTLLMKNLEQTWHPTRRANLRRSRSNHQLSVGAPLRAADSGL